jgi:serine/threonine-protein kinase RsbT
VSAGEIRVAINTDQDIVLARQNARVLATELAFSAVDATFIATAVSELARNILAYARKGEITLRAIQGSNRKGIQVVAADDGPGIADIRLALRDGFSTSGSLGIGLPGVQRLMDEFEIRSQVGHGTRVTVKKWRQ